MAATHVGYDRICREFRSFGSVLVTVSVCRVCGEVSCTAATVWGCPSVRAFGVDGAAFAFAVVWLPMAWLGTVSRLVTPRLPAGYHALRRSERDGRVHERLGVRVVKRLLGRGPLAVFNPDLHLPIAGEPTPASIARLDQRMRDAEASHAILLVLTTGVAVHAALRGWWAASVWTLLFDVLVNGYPVMLQRYNRAYLSRRFLTDLDPGTPTGHADT